MNQLDQVFTIVHDLIFKQIPNFKEITHFVLKEILNKAGSLASLDLVRELFGFLLPSSASLVDSLDVGDGGKLAQGSSGEFWMFVVDLLLPLPPIAFQPDLWDVIESEILPALSRLFSGSSSQALSLKEMDPSQKQAMCIALIAAARASLQGQVRIPLLADKLLAMVVDALQRGGGDDTACGQLATLWVRLIDARGMASALLTSMEKCLLDPSILPSVASIPTANCEAVAADVLRGILKALRASSSPDTVAANFANFVHQFVLLGVIPRLKRDVLSNTPLSKIESIYETVCDRLRALGFAKLASVLDKYRPDCVENALLVGVMAALDRVLAKFSTAALIPIMIASLKYKKGAKDVLDEVLLRSDPQDVVLEVTCSYVLVTVAMPKSVIKDPSQLAVTLGTRMKSLAAELGEMCCSFFESNATSATTRIPSFPQLLTAVRTHVSKEDITMITDQLTSVVGNFLAGPATKLLLDSLEKLMKQVPHGFDVVRDKLCEVLDEISARLGDTPLHFLSPIIDEVKEKLRKQEFVLHKVLLGLTTELSNSLQQGRVASLVVNDLILFIQSPADTKKTVFQGVSVITQSVIKSSTSIVPGILKAFIHSIVPFDLLVKLSEIFTLSIDILRNFRTDLNPDAIISLISNVSLILLPNLNLSSLMRGALVPSLVDLLSGMQAEIASLNKSFLAKLYSLVLDDIIPDLIEALATSTEFRNEVLALIDDSTFKGNTDPYLIFLSFHSHGFVTR